MYDLFTQCKRLVSKKDLRETTLRVMADTPENPRFKAGPKGMPRLKPKEMTRLYSAIDLACLEKVMPC